MTGTSYIRTPIIPLGNIGGKSTNIYTTERNTMSNKSLEERKADQRLTLHHRKPRSIGGAIKDKRNHSWIPRIQHRSWHICFGAHSAQTIAHIINEMYLDPDYEFVCVKRKEKPCGT